MSRPPSLLDDTITALLAMLTGAIAGLVVAAPTGLVMFQIAEGSCTDEYMCGLAAAVVALAVGLGLGLVAFVVAAVRSLRRHREPGHRTRPGLIVFLGLPVFLVLLISTMGLG